MASAEFTKATNFIKELSTQANIDKGNDQLSVTGRGLLAWLSTLETTSTLLGQDLQQQVALNAKQSFIPAYNYNEKIHSRGARQLEDAFSSSNNFLGTATHLKDQATIASSETHNLDTQTRQSHAIVATLKKLVKISRQLDQVDAFLGKGAIIESTQQLLAVLDELANDEEGDLHVRYRLKTNAERYKTLLANTIHDGITQGITTIDYEQGDTKILELQIQQSIPFTHGTAHTTLHIKDLMLASAMLQTQHVELTSIKRRLVKQFMNPFLNNLQQQWKHDLIQLDVNDNTDSAVIQLAISPLQPVHNEEDNVESHKTKCAFAQIMMDRSIIVIKAIFDHLFGAEEHWASLRQLFGRLFLSDVFNLLITTTIAPTVASNSTSTVVLDNLTRLATSAASFEQQCIVDCAGIMSYDSRTTSTLEGSFPLTLYVDHFDQHVAEKRRSRLLQDARSIMLRRIYDAEPIQPDGFSITQTPRVLCTMIQEISTEVEDLERQQQYKQHYPITIHTLHKTIHDILILYMSIMPSIHRTAFLQQADRAMVFRNDCVWLADQQKTMQQDSVVNKLRHLGEFWQTIVVTQLMNSVGVILDKTGEWQQDKCDSMVLDTKHQSHSPSVKHQSLHSQQQQPEQGMTLENAITAIITLVQGFATTIRPVVSGDLYQHILIQVVDAIVGRFAGDILSMSDISAEESHTMAQALNGVAQLTNVFAFENGDVVSEFTLRQWIPHWQGFWMVKEMLDMTMADILSALQRGELCMFTHDELIHLVCALFADTPRRDETLQIIKTSDLNGFELPLTATPPDLATTHSPVISSSATPPPPLLAQEQQHSRAIASKDRFAFDLDEVDDDGWNQEGWSDDDAQLDFEMNPPLHGSNAMIQSVDKASLNVDPTASSGDHAQLDFEIKPSFHRGNDMIQSVNKASFDVDATASPDPVSTHSVVGSSSARSPPLRQEQEQQACRDIASSNRFTFEMDDDDGWNQDGWSDDDAQLDLKIDLQTNNSPLDTDETMERQESNDDNAENPIMHPDTTLFSSDDSPRDNDKDETANSRASGDHDHSMDHQGSSDKATTNLIDSMVFSIPGANTAVDLDFGNEGSGWSDADHDIDLDDMLIQKSLQDPADHTDDSVPFTNNDDSTGDSSPISAQLPIGNVTLPAAQSPSGDESFTRNASPLPTQSSAASPLSIQSTNEDTSMLPAQPPPEDLTPLSDQISSTEDALLLSAQFPTEEASPLTAQSPTEDASPLIAQLPPTEDSMLRSDQVSPTEDASPLPAQSPIEDASPLPAQSPIEATSPLFAQSPVENVSPVNAQPPFENRSPLSTQLHPADVSPLSPSLAYPSMTSTDSENFHPQQDVTMTDVPSKPSPLEDTLMQSILDDDEGGGWSDAENLMDFDDPIPPPKENAVPGNTPIKNAVENLAWNAKPLGDDTLMTRSEKQATSPARNTLAMDPLLDDDDAGGGWSDADEDLFFN